MRDDRARLLDIQEAITRIDRYATRGRDAFLADELIQTWILHHLQIIGEAVRGLSHELRERHPEVPWQDIVGLHNILVHNYFGIEVARVWTVVERDLPTLRQNIERIHSEQEDHK